ncbi:MAG: ATP-binding protein [Deltaproteobacteria bacterium]|nr:ATP-binding protein [Deltaproteobacteria bacterium]
MRKDQLLQVIAEWLREMVFPPLTHREMPSLDLRKQRAIMAIAGPRRAGKTYYLYQLIQDLMESKGILREEILFVDFEDYRLQGFGPPDVDQLFTAFQQLAGRQPRFLFFDEIQHVPEWNRILRTLHNRRSYTIVVSGSNSSLLGREIATELRGRYEDLLMLPFSFREALRFYQVTFDATLFHTHQRGRLIQVFDDYLQSGGFPETLVREGASEKRKLLQTYYRTIFYKDILERYNIKARPILDQMMGSFLESYATPFSISTFEKQLKAAGLTGSKRTISNYLHFLEEAFFLITSEKFAYSPRKRMMNPKKVYLMDTGFALLGGAFTENRGYLLENVVALELLRRGRRMFYFKGTHECDFILQEGRHPSEAWQVCWELTARNEPRELKGLLEAMRQFKIPRGGILTYDQEEVRTINGLKIPIIPVWKWLLLSGEEEKWF